MVCLVLGTMSNVRCTYGLLPRLCMKALASSAHSFKNFVLQATKSTGSLVAKSSQSMLRFIRYNPQRLSVGGLAIVGLTASCGCLWFFMNNIWKKSATIKCLSDDLNNLKDDNQRLNNNHQHCEPRRKQLLEQAQNEKLALQQKVTALDERINELELENEQLRKTDKAQLLDENHLLQANYNNLQQQLARKSEELKNMTNKLKQIAAQQDHINQQPSNDWESRTQNSLGGV